MPWRDRDRLQSPVNWTLISLLFVWSFLPHLPSVSGYFMSESKALFHHGCGDYWSLLDRNQMPLLHQVSVCLDVRILSPGQWTAFTYRTHHMPYYELALQGHHQGLEVWLLGVQHHFPMDLEFHRWHHICLRWDSLSSMFRLEVDTWAVEHSVEGQAIHPAGELLLGCHGQEAAQEETVQVELYLFRVWRDIQQYGACEDGDVVGWDSTQWTVVGQSKARDDSLHCGWERSKREALPVVGELLSTLPAGTEATPDSSSKSSVTAASSVLPELVGQFQHAALTVNSTSISPGLNASYSNGSIPDTASTISTAKVPAESTANAVQTMFTNIDSYNSEEVVPVLCNFSHFCTTEEAYYWMAVAVETKGGNVSESDISSWLSGLFQTFPCDSNIAETSISNSTHSVASQSVTSSPSQTWTGDSTNSATGTLGPTSDRNKSKCGNPGQGSVSSLQEIEVTCNQKTQIRKTNCTVLLQLNQPIDSCVLSQMLQEASATGSIEAQTFGEVERVGKGLCLSEDVLPPDGRFLRCFSSTPFSSVCASEGMVNVTCKRLESEELFAEFQGSDGQICKEDQHICNCSSFCADEAAYYALVLNVTSPTLSMDDLKTTISQLRYAPVCKSMTMDQCVLSSMVAQLYQGVHLECHGTGIRLHSCMVMVKLAQPMDVCALSSVVTTLLQNNTDIAYDGTITQAAICGWHSDPSLDLLDSNFTWVSTDLSISQICGVPDPITLTCQEGEILSVLLTESCKVPFTPTATASTFSFSTMNITTVQPFNTTLYNTTALKSNTSFVSSTTFPLNTTQYNSTAFPLNTTQYNSTTFPLNTTQYNSTAFPLNTSQHNITDIIETMSNTTTNQTTVTNNTTNGTAISNTTSAITTATAANSTWPPVAPSRMPSITAPENSTAFNTAVTSTTVTTMSLEEKAMHLLNQTREISAPNASLVGDWVSELEQLLSGPNISFALGSTAIAIVSNVLLASTDVLSLYSTRVIRIVDTVGLKLVMQDKNEVISAESLALAVAKVDGLSFQETSFSISDPTSLQISVSSGTRSRGKVPVLGSIQLPPSLTDGLTSQEQMLASRVQFNFYKNSSVFHDRGLGSRKLNSGVLGTSVTNLSISGLKEGVVITLKNMQPVTGNFVASCVFWDFGYNDGSGGWNSTGCYVQNTTYDVTVCSCNHLTSFAVLLDLSRESITTVLQATILSYITYIGCGISSIFLSVTLLTYLGFEKLRKDVPSKILIQLCLALLLLNLVFLLDPWLALYPNATGLCISTGFFLHYFLLVSFTWMALEAFHMYLALVKVFNTYMSRYMLKYSLMGWGVPLVVVIIVIAINKDNYGRISYGRYLDGSTDDFCWLKNDIAFYVAVVAYFCLMFLLNIVMFVVVLVQLCRIKRQNPHNSQHRNVFQDLRSVAGLTFLLGLTWGFAFFAWGPVNLAFMYLFSIFNSLQGFFIFVFHCAIKDSVRRQWRTYLCCGNLRLAENSDWSRTATRNTANRHSVVTAPSIHSSNTCTTSFRASDTGSIGPTDSNENPFYDSTVIFPEEQFETISRQRTQRSQ